jgi:hypothetical protein
LAFTSVFIDILDKNVLKFDELKYTGKLNDDYELEIDEIPIKDDLNSNQVSFKLIDGDASFFTVDKSDSKLFIKKVAEIKESLLKNKQFMWFRLVASGDDFYPAESLVLIQLPPWASLPIDECYDLLDPTQPFFETGLYSFTVTSGETGVFGRIQAIMIDSGSLIYSLRVDDEFLMGKVSVFAASGDLHLLSKLPVGVYRFVAQATNNKNMKTSESRILLRVVAERDCEANGEIQTTIKKVLAIERLEENKIHMMIMPTNIDDCSYQVIGVSPAGYIGEKMNEFD